MQDERPAEALTDPDRGEKWPVLSELSRTIQVYEVRGRRCDPSPHTSPPYRWARLVAFLGLLQVCRKGRRRAASGRGLLQEWIRGRSSPPCSRPAILHLPSWRSSSAVEMPCTSVLARRSQTIPSSPAAGQRGIERCCAVICLPRVDGQSVMQTGDAALRP